MIVAYTAMPAAAGGGARPLLDVTIADMTGISVPCLVDSGAVNSLLPSWLATAAGIDVSDVAPQTIGVGGAPCEARFTTIRLEAASFTWEAPVGICEPWPPSWGLLGRDAFFRFFDVTFRAASLEFEVTAVTT